MKYILSVIDIKKIHFLICSSGTKYILIEWATTNRIDFAIMLT